MSSDSDSSVGAVFDYADFVPKSNFIDAETLGYESVKDKTNVKLFHISAPSSSLLSEKIEAYSKNPSIIPTKLSDDASNKFRHAVLYSDLDDLAKALNASPKTFNPIDDSPPKLCFIITCQGTQYVGMGRNAYEWSPVFRNHFDECDKIIKEEYGISVKQLMYSEDNAWIGKPVEALPYILSVEYALFNLWNSWGIKPDIVLGLSFGEYGAAVLSGIISINEAIKLVMTRTQLVTDNIEEEAFGIAEMDVSEFPKLYEQLKKEEGMEDAWLAIAGINSPVQTCVVGRRKYVLRFIEICKQTGARCMLLDPYHPYHSELCAPVIPQFEETTTKIEYKKANNGKFISTVRKGKVMESLDKDYYLEHLRGPVLFIDAVATALTNEKATHFLEVGPHPINIQMVKDVLQNGFPEMGTNFEFHLSLLRKENDRTTLFNNLGSLYAAGYNINWDNVNKLMDQ